MPSKDPAALFYIDTWLSATAEMDADVRGWYLNLVLHQFDKKDLPNDPEKLAVLACVKFSEYERFKHVLEHVLMHKFKLNDQQRLENGYAKDILRSREQFKEIRTRSANIGVAIKLAKTIKGFNYKALMWLKERLYISPDEEIEQAKDKHVLEHLLKLYINENENEDKSTDRDNTELPTTTVPPEKKIEWEKFEIWINASAPRVQKMKNPFTAELYVAALKYFTKEFKTEATAKTVMMEILVSMHNWEPLLKKNVDANLTLKKWYTMRKEEYHKAPKKGAGEGLKAVTYANENKGGDNV